MFEPTGRGWLTDAGPRIYRIEPGLGVELAYTISSNQMAGTRFDLYAPVQATLDAQGRVLFWGEQRFRELATLRGLIIASDGGFVHHPKIEGLPDRGFSTLAKLDEERLWVGLPEWDPETGLHELDLKSMRARKLAEPEPGAFAHIVDIFPLGADCYVASGDRRFQIANKTLWRWRAGQWEKVLSPLDTAPFDDFFRVFRPFLPDAQGLWVGTGGNGLLYVPRASAAPAQLFDWRRGQPLETVHRITRLDNGELMLVGFGHGSTHASPAAFLSSRRSSPRVRDIWKTAGNLQQDAQGHVWTLLTPSKGEAALGEWDGVEWKRYRVPDSIQKDDLHAIGLDSEGHFWLPYRERLWLADRKELKLTEKAVVFIPAQARWLQFSSLEDALSESARAKRQFRADLPGEYQPEFSPRGEICFNAMDWTLREPLVHYYDGEMWRHWDRRTVGYQQPGYLGQPFFIKDGRLAINITRGQIPLTCIFNGGTWETQPFRSAGARDPSILRRMYGQAAPGPDLRQITDVSGGTWQAVNQ